MNSYRIHPSILAAEERSLYHVLTLIVAQRALLFSKVKLSTLIEPAFGHNKSALGNRLDHYVVDFVFCDRSSTRPLFVILVEGTQSPEGAQVAAHEAIQPLCAAAGLPVLRLRHQSAYRMDTLQQMIEPLLSGDPRGSDYEQGDRVAVRSNRDTHLFPLAGSLFSPN